MVRSVAFLSIINRGETSIDILIVFAIRQFVTSATAGLNRNVYCKYTGQMFERRNPIGPVDIVVIGFLEHKWNEGKFTPLIAVRGKTRSLQGVAQVKQHAMSRHGQGITVRPPRDFCVDQGDYIVS